MIEVHERTGSTVLACKEFPPEQISAYGCVAYEPAGDRLLKVTDIVEKPSRDTAPSSYAVLGRYVFSPSIFDALARVEPGTGGEIQLTDGIAALMKKESVYAYSYKGVRYDCGSKEGFLQATVELALAHPEVGGEFRSYLKSLEL
jgi:UTP--glucose-1-phosphate uridylyltransferase